MSQIIVKKLSEQEKKDLRIPAQPKNAGPWSVWECGPSSFDWHYDETEHAYLYEGRVTVTTAQQKVEIKAGDYVTFPAGLDCHWTVVEKVRKIYQFE